jgi:hypothetical protein
VHRRLLSRNTNKMQLCNRIYYSKVYLKAQHVSSGTPLIIRSSKLYLQPLVYIPIWWPAVAKAEWAHSAVMAEWTHSAVMAEWAHTAVMAEWASPLSHDSCRQPQTYANQRLQLKFLSSWWWVVCRSKHVEQLRNIGIINSTTRSHLVGYF